MRRVVKIGGSLLLRRDLPAALDVWFATQSPAQNLVLVGGGELIESVRHLDQVHHLDTVSTHWMCVELLNATYRVLRELLPAWHGIDNPEQFERAVRDGFDDQFPTLIIPACFFHQNCETPLPSDWRTTTDSIAAFLAIRSDADEVVLLKSCAIDASATLSQWIDAGVVDAAMAMIGPQINQIRVERLPPFSE